MTAPDRRERRGPRVHRTGLPPVGRLVRPPGAGMMTGPSKTSSGARFFLLFIPVAFATYAWHEAGHWIIGECLGNAMTYGLNNVSPQAGHYLHPRHALRCGPVRVRAGRTSSRRNRCHPSRRGCRRSRARWQALVSCPSTRLRSYARSGPLSMGAAGWHGRKPSRQARVEWLATSERSGHRQFPLASRVAEAPGSRTQPSRGQREATDFEDREGHRAPFASIACATRLTRVGNAQS
jgi:hypothetical protein